MLNPGLILLRAIGELTTTERSVRITCATIEGSKPRPDDAGDDYQTEYWPSAIIDVIGTSDIGKKLVGQMEKGNVYTIELFRGGLSMSDNYVGIDMGESDDDEPRIVYLNQSDLDEIDDLDAARKDGEIFRYTRLNIFDPRNVYLSERLSFSDDDSGRSKSSSKPSGSRRNRRRSALRDEE